MRVISTEKLPIKIWLDYLEDGAEEQAKHLANLPFTFKHVAIMPDSHEGFGMPIGGVLATEGVVIPNAVGVDIGCGMCAVRTTLTDLDVETRKAILGKIRDTVPVGFDHHKEPQEEHLMPKDHDSMFIVKRHYEGALRQLGTLGGGNHFIELQKGSDGFIWVMVHSGSRNFGLQIAKYYNDMAVSLNAKWRSEVPKFWELAFLPIESDEGKAYMKEMQYAVDFAYANRMLMMDRVMDAIDAAAGFFIAAPRINIAHNYAAWENHFGKNVIVHRKGATRAFAEEEGIIPGSMGTKSYIVEGLGNEQSFMSCSHGAGRKMSRKKAKSTLDLQEQIDMMEAQGIVHGIRNIGDLDEAPGSYKDIDEVMANQVDLVKVLVELQPLAGIKG